VYFKKQRSAIQEYNYFEENSKEIWDIHFILLIVILFKIWCENETKVEIFNIKLYKKVKKLTR
jgi:hypothetical protein